MIVSKDPKYRFLVEEIDRHGNVRVYFRRGKGPRQRIRESMGTPGFHAAYLAALEASKVIRAGTEPVAGRAATPVGSLLWLCRRYLAESVEFSRLGITTQSRRRSILERFCQEPQNPETDPRPVGALPFAELPVSRLRKLRDRIATRDGNEAGNAAIKALRQVFVWAIGDDVPGAERNPAREIPYLKPKNPNGFTPWTVDDVLQFEKHHKIGTKARLALALLLNLGPRRSDVVSLGKQHIRRPDQVSDELREIFGGRFIAFNVFKGRKKKPVTLFLPMMPQLETVLDQSPLGALTFIETAFKKPFTANGFGNWFKRRCVEAKLPHLSAHGLRKAAATIAAERGATPHQLMAIFGWSTIKEAERYTRAANQKRLAASGMKLVAGGQN